MKVKDHTALSHLPILLLFGVFAASVMMVLLTGAGVYKRLAERDNASYGRRTAAQYLATRVRQGDQAGCVTVAAFDGSDGCDTLFLQENIDGVLYDTRVYCYDGYLRELFAASGAEFSPEDGEKIMRLRSLSFRSLPGAVAAEVTAEDGETLKLYFSLRSGEEAAS